MLESLYNGAAAMHVLNRQHELTSNNLANVNTPGHRRAHFALAEKNSLGDSSRIGSGPEIQQRTIDFSQGRHEETGRPLDAAIMGDAFFEVQGPEGSLFTRNGRFYRDGESGTLVNEDGYPVAGASGSIQFPPSVSDREITIQSDGGVFAAGQQIGQLSVVAFEDNNQLKPISQALYAETNQSQQKPADAQVVQGVHEMSNVNPVNELIQLIVGSRQFEAVQRASKMISDTLGEHIRT